jgi:hypothetical protein
LICGEFFRGSFQISLFFVSFQIGSRVFRSVLGVEVPSASRLSRSIRCPDPFFSFENRSLGHSDLRARERKDTGIDRCMYEIRSRTIAIRSDRGNKKITSEAHGARDIFLPESHRSLQYQKKTPYSHARMGTEAVCLLATGRPAHPTAPWRRARSTRNHRLPRLIARPA